MSNVVITGNASGTGDFTIAAPNSNTNRTLTLPDEAGTVATQGYVGTQSLGVDQTWQNVAASRTHTSTYYNTTGKPILVSIIVNENRSTGAYQAFLKVDGIFVSSASGVWNANESSNTLSAIVPNGSSYVFVPLEILYDTFNYWSELR